MSLMRRSSTIVAIVLALSLSTWGRKEETLEELKARAQTANVEDRPGVCVRIAEHQLDDLRRILEALNEVEELTKDGPAGVAERIDDVRKRLMGSKELVSADSLTGLPNRRELERRKVAIYGEATVKRSLARLHRLGLPAKRHP